MYSFFFPPLSKLTTLIDINLKKMGYLFFLMYYICINTITNIRIVLTTYFFSQYMYI